MNQPVVQYSSKELLFSPVFIRFSPCSFRKQCVPSIIHLNSDFISLNSNLSSVYLQKCHWNLISCITFAFKSDLSDSFAHVFVAVRRIVL